MMNKQQSTESGQILVFLAITTFILIGFSAALALDGGQIFAERRHAQNGTDAASLAGGSAAGMVLDQLDYEDFACGLSLVATAKSAAASAAITRAASNDFSISATSDTDPDENEVAVECTVFDNGSFIEKYLDIKTKVGSDVTTAFLQFVYNGPVKNTVNSVVRVFPRTPLAYGNAIVSLSPNCTGNEGGVTFDGGGNSEINVNGGGIFSNSCLELNGSALEICVGEDPMEDCEGDGSISYVTDYDTSGNPTVNPPPEQVDIPIPIVDVTPPDCSAVPDRGQHQGGGTIQPGRYSKIKLPSGTLTMQPGLYCLNGDFTVTGGTLLAEDVTIFMASGDFSTSGSATQQMDAPPAGCGSPGCPPAMEGMLIYMAESNPGTVKLAGNTDSNFEGTVYVPTGTITLGGGSSTLPTFNTQLIGWTVKVHGNVTIDIHYQGGLNYKEPATLDMYR